ncbi:serine hydrolase domain-containing protein [Ningiella sp. W23]|uniref:serine hydrolase domain-containing protein n=1 Tax=Ningiella sp. W23 TaxID=3023715 RepID=UPI0037569F2E
MPRVLRFFCFTVFLLTVFGCHFASTDETGTTLKPQKRSDGWQVSSLADKNFDTNLLMNMMEAIEKGKYVGISSVLIAKNNELVFEAYPGKFGINDIHSTRSASKSITSVLVGIAIDKGYLSSEHEKVLPMFPEYEGKIAAWSEQKLDISLHHLLSMTSGVKGNESAMYHSDDWIKFFFDQPLVNTPGRAFSYATSGAVVLGNVITRGSKKRIPEFSNTYLFEPLGITEYKWPITNSLGSQGLAMTGGGLQLRPRDMLKIGQLYLNNGTWNGQQVVSKRWIEKSVYPHSVSDLYGEGYGYLWRIIERKINGKPLISYEAWGNGGQFIMVFPELELVTVFTGENYGKFPETEQPFELLDKFILPVFLKGK